MSDLIFDSIPVDLRTPGSFVEFNASRANRGPFRIQHKILVIGQKLVAGSAVAAVPVPVRTVDEAIALFGRGSMLHGMFARLKAADTSTETWALPLADDAGGTAATKTITVTGAATAAGSVALLVGGVKVSVAVASGAALATVATAIGAAINAKTDLPATAAVNAGVVTVTLRHKGEAGSDLDIRKNYYAGEADVPGIAIAIAAGVAGATNPDITAALAAVGDEAFTSFVMPYTDAANLTALETALTSRWGQSRMIDGLAWAAKSGAYSAQASFGPTRNSPYVSCLGLKGCPNPPWELAAAWGAVNGYALAIDPARPTQTLELPGILPPVLTDRFTRDERDLLLRAGVSTATVDSGGVVRVERAITMSQTNPAGFADKAFLDVNTPATLSALRYSLRARIATKYPRHKLADDEAVVATGQPTVTPKGMKAELISWFQDEQEAGLVEGLEQFKAELVVQRNAMDRNRLDALLPPDLVNQFRIFAAQIQFLL